VPPFLFQSLENEAWRTREVENNFILFASFFMSIVEVKILFSNASPLCWHYDTGLALWHRCCPWWQLTQIADHCLGSHNERKRDIRRCPLMKSCIHAGLPIKSRVCVRTKKHVRVGKLIFGPWYLVLGIWTIVSRLKCWNQVFGPRYWFFMVLDHGIV